jgi:hypothetical protein
MTKVFPGRYTAAADEPFVVFLIGMRVNRLRAMRRWIPVANAMGPMLTTLYKNPEKGFLGGNLLFGWRAVTMIQYWRSYDDLERFARSAADPHVPAWRWYNRAIGDDGSVGIWHETYLVEPGRYEAIYGNMPRVGLAAATAHVPLARGSHSRGRIEHGAHAATP